MSKWKKVKCKTCGFEFQSHPDVLDEEKLNGECILCFHTRELRRECNQKQGEEDKEEKNVKIQ